MPTTSTNTRTQKSREQCLKKFLYYFKRGFRDNSYFAWEREYKQDAHQAFTDSLSREQFHQMLSRKQYKIIANLVLNIESKTNLLFSFEKMAIRDAVKIPSGAKAFALGLFALIYGDGQMEQRFNNWIAVVRDLPRKQTRVLTWPVLTVFGFIADPLNFIFLKPRVTQRAAEKYKFDFQYSSKPAWLTYQSLLAFAERIRIDARHLHPVDYIDLQSFIWVIGSEEYPD